jgi:hypothetical protein
MKASPEIELLVGTVLCVYSLVILWSTIRRPKLLDHWLLRPRWWGTGPRAGRIGAAFGGMVWLLIGVWLIGLAANRLGWA